MARKAASGGTPAVVALERAGVSFTSHVYEHDPAHSGSLRRAGNARLEGSLRRAGNARLEGSLRRAGNARLEGYGLEAAERLGLDPHAVFKTLVCEVDEDLVVAIVPVSGQLDLKALAAAVGGKRAALAEPSAAERATGYVVGGISPLGQKRRHRTVLDASAGELPTIYVSGGKRGLDLGLAPTDLVELLGAVLAPIGRG